MQDRSRARADDVAVAFFDVFYVFGVLLVVLEVYDVRFRMTLYSYGPT